MSTQTNSDKELKSQQELSNTTDSKNSLIDIEVLENTPFGIVSIEGKSFGVIGQNRITEEYEDIQKLKKDFSRPHYHACLFNCFFGDRKRIPGGNSGSPLYRSDTLERLWPYGYSSIGDVTFESAA